MNIHKILSLRISDIHPTYDGVRGKTMSARSQNYAWPIIKEAGVHTIIDLRNDGINQRMINLCKEYGMEYFYYPIDNRTDIIERMVNQFPELCKRIDQGGFYIACAMGLHRTDIALCTYWVFYGANKGVKPPTLWGYLKKTGHDTSKILRILNAFYDKLTDRLSQEPMSAQEFKYRKQVIMEQNRL